MMTRFTIRRADGRSNQQVIIDLVKDAAPGTVFDYDMLSNALSEGMDKRYSLREVQSIVNSAAARMLKQCSRTLHNVPRVGYRVAPGSYHLTLANQRKEKADRQLEHGLLVLRHVRWDEMDANQRLAHEGQLLIVSAIQQQMHALAARQDQVERMLKKIRSDGTVTAPDAS